MPMFETSWIEDVYDELEILGFPVTRPIFDLLKTDFRGEATTKNLLNNVNKTIRVLGNFVADKDVMTKRNDHMKFGTFLDVDGEFFDTSHFPPSLKVFPLKGDGVYLIMGKVVEEFNFPSIEVEKLAKLPIKSDP